MKSTQGEALREMEPSDGVKRRVALKFVLMIGVVSLFADFTYEGSRSITGPFLQTLGATGAVVGPGTYPDGHQRAGPLPFRRLPGPSSTCGR